MGYKVKIVYDPSKIPSVEDRNGASVCALFEPNNSYVDGEAYDGTRYDSNVKGFGSIDQVEPYATTGLPLPVPLAQLKAGQIGEPGDGEERVVELKGLGYKGAVFYKQLAVDVADQGFEITVEEEAGN